ncbi:MAG: FIST C-terminal domain-containing protein [Candidatus Eisenbacteria bacterium]|uniref:FIST C-terminal domain-containing protein n=1 Tax=Eiseniibacteriota bacterium TaxID=2212470 RepID=A0A933SB42_UNCEI|nr:FIST C-terminal domain-containing protein [Candidatus Eisenbacteria bacterium]
MKLVTFRHDAEAGWSEPLDSSLDSPRTLVLLFGAADVAGVAGPIADVVAAFPRSHVTGCSTAGEIHGTAIHDHSVVVAVAQFDHTEVRVAHAVVEEAVASFEAGRHLAEALDAEDLGAILVLSDGLAVNGSELVRGVNGALSHDVSVTGGLAGDGPDFVRTWVLRDGVPARRVVAAIGLYGSEVRVTHGSRGGWDKFGPERIVTRSVGNVLFELDGKPALDLYKRYLGERATGLPATGLLFPLALRRDAKDENVVVRTLLAVDEERRSMTFAGDIPQGWMCQLMSANFDRVIAGAGLAAESAMSMDADADGPVLSIAISCVGRRLILGERTEEELEATLDVLPPGTQQVGFYSYGELSPHANGRCDLHNQTMTLTAIRELERRAA